MAAFCILTVSLSILIKVIQDARRRAEETASALAESRERLATILATISDAVIATDADGCVTFMNGIAQSLTGWDSQVALGRPVQELFTLIGDDTHIQVEGLVQKVLKSDGGEKIAYRGVLIGKNGIETPISDSSRMLG